MSVMKHYVIQIIRRYEVDAVNMNAALKQYRKDYPESHPEEIESRTIVCEDTGDEQPF